MIYDIDTGRIRRALGTALAILLLAACQPGGPSALSRHATTTASPNAAASASQMAARKHVFVIVLENTSYRLALAQPYISSLASQYGVATNYHDLGNPSLPNYLAMSSGSTWGITDDNYHELPATGIGQQLTDAGISWKAYFEGFTGDCFNSPYPYALKHNPFAYYGGECPSNVVPLTELQPDLDGNTPQMSWITPGLCNDGHDCGIGRADQWLSQVVPQITGSAAWQQNGILLITWDESSAGDSQVGLLIVTPNFQGEVSTRLDHFSLLATIEDLLGVPRLRQAAQASSIAGKLKKPSTTKNAGG
jgi:phosphatidylinositol-3-phosphatase